MAADESKTPDGKRLTFEVEFSQRTGLIFQRGADVQTGTLLPRSHWLVSHVRKSVGVALASAATEMTACIKEALAADDIKRAVECVREGIRKGALEGILGADLLDSVAAINLEGLDSDTRREMLDFRIELAARMHRFESLETDAKAFLAEFSNAEPELLRSVRLARANGASQAGKRELAEALYRELLRDPDLSVANRAWALRGLTLTLDRRADERRSLARQAADLFLQLGDRYEAGGSLLGIAQDLEYQNPRDALAVVDESLALLDRNSPAEAGLAAEALFKKASILLRHERASLALPSAQEAIAILQSMGAPAEMLVAAFQIAREAAEKLGQSEEVTEYDAHLGQLAGEVSGTVDALRMKIAAEVQASTFRPEEFEADVRKSGAPNLLFDFLLMKCMGDGVAYDRRLEILEEAAALTKRGGRLGADDAMAVLAQAFAETYRAGGDKGKALSWYRTVLQYDPYDSTARQNTAALLFELGRWDEAIIHIQGELARFGELPVMTFFYGRALLEAGRANEAVPVLNRAHRLRPGDAACRQYLDRALQAADNPDFLPKGKQDPPPKQAVSRSALEESLAAFATFIERSKRMEFWRRDGAGPRRHKWTASPEQLARNLLHTYLKAAFGDALEAFEDLPAGAGRIDLFLAFAGGLRVVLELKMCGSPYSTTYAVQGGDQLVHYMANRGTSIGYLVVFDGRTRDFAEGLPDITHTGQFTIQNRVVDVRPVVTPREKKR